MVLQHSLRQVMWHLRLAHGGLLLRVSQGLCMILVVAGLGAAVGHAIVKRSRWANDEAPGDIARDGSFEHDQRARPSDAARE